MGTVSVLSEKTCFDSKWLIVNLSFLLIVTFLLVSTPVSGQQIGLRPDQHLTARPHDHLVQSVLHSSNDPSYQPGKSLP